MKFRNPLRSLTWSSLFASSHRSRWRRRRTGGLPLNVAAEVLEVRSLLSANVAAAVAGTALTLTSDNNGGHNVHVYRLDANPVEVDAPPAGTTINGGASAVFTLSSVSGITVNLGNGADTYHVFSKSGDPALNVGSGGIVFQGAGGTVDDLEVFNESASPMTIAGNVTVQGTAPGSALGLNGATKSEFDLATVGSGSLTVDGSVLFNINGAGTGPQYNQIYTLGAGDLSIVGSVTETSSQSSSGFQSNEVFANGTDNLLIGGNVTQSTSGGGAAENSVSAEGSPANVKIAGAVAQSAQGGSGLSFNTISTFSNLGGNVSIGLGATQSATSHDARDDVWVAGSGSRAVATQAGGISQTASTTGGASTAENDVFTDASGTGSLSVGGSVVQAATSAYSEINHVFNNGSGNLTVGQQIQQSVALSTSHGTENLVYNKSSGAFSVGQSVSQTAYSASSINNSVYDFLN